MLKYDTSLKPYSRQLRSNMTDAEQLLWQHLRRKQILGVQFYRQKIIGRFIVDFYAPAISLVIELDGGQHFEPDAQEYDRWRDAYLRQQGLQVMRFDNIQVLKETDAVLRVIHDFAVERTAKVADEATEGAAYLAGVEQTLNEWSSEADERAYREF